MANVQIVDSLDFTDKKELGESAVFSLSTAKPGNGVEQLRDDQTETYWQSDGPAPHIINVNFMEKKTISDVCIYCDYQLDESYTIKKVCIRSGSCVHDLVDVAVVELYEPVGWVVISLANPIDSSQPLRAHMLQFRVLSMHQNGRDNHIRQLKILGPRSIPKGVAGIPLDRFKTVAMSQYSLIR